MKYSLYILAIVSLFLIGICLLSPSLNEVIPVSGKAIAFAVLVLLTATYDQNETPKTMTKYQAIALSESTGVKITHTTFSDDEYIICKGDVIEDEKGYQLNAKEFWKFRTSEWFDSNWTEFKNQ